MAANELPTTATEHVEAPLRRISTGKYKKYSLKLKKQLIEKAKDLGCVAKAQRALNLGHIKSSLLRRWVKNQDKILKIKQTFTRSHKALDTVLLVMDVNPVLVNMN